MRVARIGGVRVIRVGEAAQRLSHSCECSGCYHAALSVVALCFERGVNRRGSEDRHCVCGGDALVTDIHDAFRPSCSVQGVSSGAVSEWRGEGGSGAGKSETADSASAESGDDLAAFFSTFC